MLPRILRTGDSDTARAEAFSDGVLAIVITLLVLDLKVPQQVGPDDAALWRALAQQLPTLGAWALSFCFVLVFWVAHHYFFEQLTHVDRGLLWLNGLFLLTISFTPFPAAVLGLYPGRTASATLLSAAMFLTASSFLLMRWYATRHAGLIKPQHNATASVALRRSAIAPVIYAAAICAAQVAVPVAIVLLIVVPVVFFFPHPSREAA